MLTDDRHHPIAGTDGRGSTPPARAARAVATTCVPARLAPSPPRPPPAIVTTRGAVYRCCPDDAWASRVAIDEPVAEVLTSQGAALIPAFNPRQLDR